jgi:hypothetical protein
MKSTVAKRPVLISKKYLAALAISHAYGSNGQKREADKNSYKEECNFSHDIE